MREGNEPEIRGTGEMAEQLYRCPVSLIPRLSGSWYSLLCPLISLHLHIPFSYTVFTRLWIARILQILP